MTTIKKDFGQGGANLAPNAAGGGPSLAQTLRDEADDFDTLKVQFNLLRTAYLALLAKLDADGGVTDTNYAATCAPPAAVGTLKTLKG